MTVHKDLLILVVESFPTRYSRTPVERPPSPTTIPLIWPYFVWRTLFSVVRSLTNDHPSDATNDRVRWDFLPRERPPRLQCISKNRGWRFNIRSQWWIITMLCLDTFQEIQLIWTFFYLATTPQRRSQIYVASLRCCQPAAAQTHL